MAEIIFLRHCESIWNLENKFTGWVDIPLSKKGISQAKRVGKKLSKKKFDVAFVSNLIRAQQTLFGVLNENEQQYLVRHKKGWNTNFNKKNLKLTEIEISSKLNERYYGDIQGLNKDETKKKFGCEQVHIWRRSFDTAPPKGESLKKTFQRCVPYFKKEILKELKNNKNVLVVAHGNSIRSILMEIENLTKKEIENFEIETGKCLSYEFKKGIFKKN